MENMDKTFLWDDPITSRIYPIDYTPEEIAHKFGQDDRTFSERVLKNPLFKGILLKLSPPENSMAKPSENGPPIPLEAVSFLDCFYQLARQVPSGYHSQFLLYKSEPPKKMQAFWSDFCFELYKRTVPPQDPSEPDPEAFCRHILFKNEQFVSALLTPIWEKEIQKRFDEIKALANQIGLQPQIGALRDCLMSLDRIILNLKLQVQSRSATESSHVKSPVTTESLQTLLKSLLSIRMNGKKDKGSRVVYEVLESTLSDNTSLERAFNNIVRGQNMSNESKRLLPMARQAYLWRLAKEVETPETLELENQYIGLYNYLTSSSSYKPEELDGKIRDSCSRYCRYIIDNNTYSLDSEDAPPPHPSPYPYKNDLLDNLIYLSFNQTLNYFQEIFQSIAFHNACRYSAHFSQEYLQRYLYSLEPFIKSNESSEADSNDIFSEIDSIINNSLIIPSAVPRDINPFYRDLTEFYPYFQKAFQFITGEEILLFEQDTYKLIAPNKIASVLWEYGKVAAEFFSREKLSFESADEARHVLDICDQIVSNPEDLFPPVLFHKSICRILNVLLILILKKAVDDSVPMLSKYVKSLFEPNPKPAQ